MIFNVKITEILFTAYNAYKLSSAFKIAKSNP